MRGSLLRNLLYFYICSFLLKRIASWACWQTVLDEDAHSYAENAIEAPLSCFFLLPSFCMKDGVLYPFCVSLCLVLSRRRVGEDVNERAQSARGVRPFVSLKR